MEHIELVVTEEQRQNLKILADYLSTGNTDLDFDMETYNNGTGFPSKWKCGTVACAAGHGPAAGIKALSHENWNKYIERVFGSIWNEINYIWMFSGIWFNIDNTPQGAAKRIYYALENGIPEDYQDQMRGINYIFE